MKHRDSVKAAALKAAATAATKASGELSRRELLKLAELYGFSESTARRISAQGNELRIPTARAHAPIRDGNPLLLALAAGGGVRRRAWEVARTEHGYEKSYRTFLRDLERLDPAVVQGVIGGYSQVIENRIYTSMPALHRNSRWHIDSTKADIFVHVPRGTSSYRPWITLIVDASTDIWMTILVTDNQPNTESITRAIAQAACGGDQASDSKDWIGGLPQQLVFDNGREHLNRAVLEGCLRLGIVATPTTPYSPWENGRVERAHRTVGEFLATLPGSPRGGHDRSKKSLYGPMPHRNGGHHAETSPTGSLSLDQLQVMLEAFRQQRNQRSVDNKPSPIERWRSDTTELFEVPQALLLAHLAQADRPRTVNKAGIAFRNINYVAQCLAPYRRKRLMVRYLPSVTEWIEVFDGTKYVGRAYRADQLPSTERNRILLQRARQDKQLRLIQGEEKRRRRHLTKAEDSGWPNPHEDELSNDPTAKTEPPLPPITYSKAQRLPNSKLSQFLKDRTGLDLPFPQDEAQR